jgi:3'(2'), 5'-bisphosphate nucleotidase
VLQVLLILEGKAHAYVFASPGCKKWDTCAPEAILHAAGGKLTDLHGNNFTYEATVQRRNTGGVLGTPRAEDHQWYMDRIPAEVREALPV